MSECRSCGAPIEWARTEHGKMMPLDLDEVENGNLLVLDLVATEHGMAPLVRYVDAGEGDRVSHFATCEHAEKHRRRST